MGHTLTEGVKNKFAVLVDEGVNEGTIEGVDENVSDGTRVSSAVDVDGYARSL